LSTRQSRHPREGGDLLVPEPIRRDFRRFQGDSRRRGNDDGLEKPYGRNGGAAPLGGFLFDRAVAGVSVSR